MLTRAGFATLIVSAAVLAGGRIFGLPEMFVVGAAGLTIVGIAIVYVAFRRLKFRVQRQLTPPRVHAGNQCRVDLYLQNRARLRSPVVRLRDEVSGTQGVELLVAPLRPDATGHALYRLPTNERGVLIIGPLKLTVTDPFGLARLSTTGDEAVSLVVYPVVYDIDGAPNASGELLDRSMVQQRQVASAGDEFYGLREYAVGDDLRRVHWPSTARHDELMVRQDEIPSHGHLTVLLDTRSTPDGVDFEEMVRAAASVSVAGLNRGEHVRLLTSGSKGCGYGTGPHHRDRILEVLATVTQQPDVEGDLALRMGSESANGSSVVVTAQTEGVSGAPFITVSGRYRRRVLVVFADSTATPLESTPGLRSITVVAVPASSSFADAWRRQSGKRALSHR